MKNKRKGEWKRVAKMRREKKVSINSQEKNETVPNTKKLL
jgi:hypothetical protein